MRRHPFALALVCTALLLRAEGGAQTLAFATCSSFTVATWVKLQGFTPGVPYPRIFQGPSFYVHSGEDDYYGEDGNITIGFSGVPKTTAYPRGVSVWSSDVCVPRDTWAHYALVVAEGHIVFYVNGRAARTYGGDQPLNETYPSGVVTFGNTAIGGNRALDALFALPRVEARACTAAEIAAWARQTPDGEPVNRARTQRQVKDELPVIDVSGLTDRQTVIAAGTTTTYQGHPTTALSTDGKTVFCVWTIGHGGPCGPVARSDDGGRTWTRIDAALPANYAASHRNCPVLQRVKRPDGGWNLAIFSCISGGCGIVISTDEGLTWQEAPVAALSAGMPPTGFMTLKDGSAALFGQFRKDASETGDGPYADQGIWMSVSKDGGWTWSAPRTVAVADEKNLCEPCCLRSPDGGELALLMRENRHHGRSMMCFSRDEGETWSTPTDTCWGLTGDRHEAVYLPDGRLFVAFRDRAHGSSTHGQYVAWVGTYADLRAGKPGDFRVRILNHRDSGARRWDTGYSGVEVLPDGTILCTTYMKYWADDRLSSVVTTRLTLNDFKN